MVSPLIPKRLKSSGVKRLLERALWTQGIRQPLKDGEKRHEFKAAHGFRKFYDTNSNTAMRPINVELTMGHSTGISESYYKPTEDELLKDYLNAVDQLTINDESQMVRKEIVELQKRSIDNEYILKARMQEMETKSTRQNSTVLEMI